MTNTTPVSRRKWLQSMVGGAGALVSSSALGQTLGQVCGLTPPQTQGPFYPVADQADKDTDLTRVRGRVASAAGEVILVQGQVRDQDCSPVSGALVEIWQACASGRYNHPSDDNPAPLDPNFQYWGQAVTDSEGRYSFKTIKPGAYPAAPDWIRPPHIHFKVTRKGYHELITQMYFAGEELNDRDQILLAVPEAERASVIVDFDPGTRAGVFDLTLRRPIK